MRYDVYVKSEGGQDEWYGTRFSDPWDREQLPPEGEGIDTMAGKHPGLVRVEVESQDGGWVRETYRSPADAALWRRQQRAAAMKAATA